MKSRWVYVVTAAVIFGILAVGQAYAAGNWEWYDVTVPSWGGSTTTNNVWKVANEQASVRSNLIGADCDLRIMLEDVNFNAKSNWYVINDGTFLRYNTTANVNAQAHMRIKTDAFDPVNVQANGHWSPDSPQ